MADAPTRPAKKTITPGAWQEARALVYAHRSRLAVGLALMLVNRLAGLVLPSSSKWVIDRVINQHHPELLLPLALAAGGGHAGAGHHRFRACRKSSVWPRQRAITDMRRTVQALRAAAADQLFRFDQEWDPDLPHHDRRLRESGTWWAPGAWSSS